MRAVGFFCHLETILLQSGVGPYMRYHLIGSISQSGKALLYRTVGCHATANFPYPGEPALLRDF